MSRAKNRCVIAHVDTPKTNGKFRWVARLSNMEDNASVGQLNGSGEFESAKLAYRAASDTLRRLHILLPEP